jgi:hypothetical protein
VAAYARLALISLALQHHPSRTHLLYRTSHLDPEVVVDPKLDSHPSPWRTYREALERTPACSHRVILQDDAEPCDGFLEALTLCLAARPDSLVCLFVPTTHPTGSRAVLEACGRGSGWAALPWGTFVPVVGLAWPHALVTPFLQWADEKGFKDIPRHRSDDAIVGLFAKAMNLQAWATVPSLVEHPDDDPSLIGLKTRVPRRAACFAGANAHLVDWTV